VTRTLRHSHGYVLEYAPDHPRAHNGFVYQHIAVWEREHGPVPQGWHVHHRNGVRDDNQLENLEALSVAEHHRRHPETPEQALARGRKGAEERKRRGGYVQPTHCRRGHEFTPENTGIQPRGRFCKECRRLKERERYHLAKAVA
jgi:hypothetical protein